jgi:hypothetical protein
LTAIGEKGRRMTDDKEGPRVYGTPAPGKQLPPASEGMRGEGAPQMTEAKSDQTRTVNADGQEIEVVETSGIASAESKGAADIAKSD